MAGNLASGPWGQGQPATSSDSQGGFSVISPASWQDKEPPRRDWMVENCFLRGTVGLVSGEGGVGKSMIMQQLATSVVLGRLWLGLMVKPGRALYLACEDDRDELWRRQAAINRSLGCEMADVGDAGLALSPRVGQDNALVKFDRAEWRVRPTGLLHRLANHCRERGVQYVVVDTATQTFRGNQNDETQVVDYISELRRLAIAIEGVVILTKHPSMAGRALGTGESGNVAWSNSVRARLYLHKLKDGGLVLEGMKANYGPSGLKIPLQWRAGVYETVEQQPPINYYEREE